MYIPPKFTQNDVTQLHDLIREYPLAAMVVNNKEGLDAMHLPLLLRKEGDKDKLVGHIAKANPIWRTTDVLSTLAIFKGPDHYISPNFYPTKQQHGRAVPTWNYTAVHVKGTISFTHEAAWLLNTVDELTRINESTQLSPWSINDAPENYIDSLLRAIVGVEISIETIEGKWKLSQNQPDVNQNGIVDELYKKSTEAANRMAMLVKTGKL